MSGDDRPTVVANERLLALWRGDRVRLIATNGDEPHEVATLDVGNVDDETGVKLAAALVELRTIALRSQPAPPRPGPKPGHLKSTTELRAGPGIGLRGAHRVPPPHDHAEIDGARCTHTMVRVLNIVETTPAGMASTEVARALKMARQSAISALLRLEGAGLVRRTGQSRGTRWFPTHNHGPEA